MSKTCNYKKKKNHQKMLSVRMGKTKISEFRYSFHGMQGSIKKKVKISVFIISLFFILSVRPSSAFLGFGDIVFDPGNLIQNILNGAQAVTSAVNSASQTANQIKSLEYQLQNLAQLDQGSALSTMDNLRMRLSLLMGMQSNIRGMTMQYAQVEGAWDKLYKDFGKYNGMKGSDYSAEAQKILQQTDNATYDAMRAQGLVSELGNDAENLKSLLNASNTSGGALSAAQAGNAIAALQTQQLMRLQQILAYSYRAQSSYYAEQSHKDAMSRANSEQFFKKTIQRPGDGQGQGTKRY